MFKKIKHSLFLTSFLPRFIAGLCVISLMTLYSATSSFYPYAYNQAIWILIGFTLMWLVSYVPVYALSLISYPCYMLAFALLIGVSLFGHVGMGAKRWLDLPLLRFQPTELFRLAIILALAKFFSDCDRIYPVLEVNRPVKILLLLIFVFVPTVFIIKQPDLGSGLLVLGVSFVMAFFAGIHIWKFVVCGVTTLLTLPIFWHFLHDYQKKRILVFLNPDLDPKHASYHVIQSKIAIGSGGMWGTGYLQGPQSHLNFLPEKHTDFIFTMFCEEWGFMAAFFVILVYGMLIAYNYHVGLNTKDKFEQLVCLGIATSLFIYVFVNIAMVTGLAPVVGIPLPFMSYGRTALMMMFLSQGIILSIARRQKEKYAKRWTI